MIADRRLVVDGLAATDAPEIVQVPDRLILVDGEATQRIVADYFRDHSDVVAVYLFGSVARGRAGPSSDVDIGVLYRFTPPATLLGQPYQSEAELSELLDRRAQLVVMNSAPVDLVHRVLRDGVLLVERDRSLRIAFEVDARSRFFDLLPVLKQYRSKESA